jgi:hypothetical protein
MESVSGPIPFPAGKQTLQTQARSTYVKVTGGETTIVLPATSIVVSRTPNVDAAYLNGATSEDGGGPYLHNPDDSLVIAETTTTLGQALEIGHQYPDITVASTAGFPDMEGYLVFGFGYGYQVDGALSWYFGPMAFILDPTFTFPIDVPNGATVNLAAHVETKYHME